MSDELDTILEILQRDEDPATPAQSFVQQNLVQQTVAGYFNLPFAAQDRSEEGKKLYHPSLQAQPFYPSVQPFYPSLQAAPFYPSLQAAPFPSEWCVSTIPAAMPIFPAGMAAVNPVAMPTTRSDPVGIATPSAVPFQAVPPFEAASSSRAAITRRERRLWRARDDHIFRPDDPMLKRCLCRLCTNDKSNPEGIHECQYCKKNI